MNNPTDTRTHKPGDTLKALDLVIGDIVTLSGPGHAFDHTVVKNIRKSPYRSEGPDEIVLARPYAVLTDIVTTAGIGVSLGTEEYTVTRDADLTFVLVHPSDVGRHWAAVTAERQRFEAEIARLRDELSHRDNLASTASTAARQADDQIQSLLRQVKGLQADCNQRGELLQLAEEQRRAAEALALEKESALREARQANVQLRERVALLAEAVTAAVEAGS